MSEFPIKLKTCTDLAYDILKRIVNSKIYTYKHGKESRFLATLNKGMFWSYGCDPYTPCNNFNKATFWRFPKFSADMTFSENFNSEKHLSLVSPTSMFQLSWNLEYKLFNMSPGCLVSQRYALRRMARNRDFLPLF